MLSYQHAYHAGGPADVHKHMVLAELIAALTVKSRPVSYAETHAGRGLYHLDGAESRKTGEADQGIRRLNPDPATPFGAAYRNIRGEYGPGAYPGSPLLASALLRPGDRSVLMELHPAEHAALVTAMAGRDVAIHRRDGYEGLLALAPMTPRRGLVLVDPSYEVKSEYAEAARFVRALAGKWPQVTVAVWYPLLPAARHTDLRAGFSPLSVTCDEVIFTPAPDRGMYGSGMALINVPFGFGRALKRIHLAAQTIFTPQRPGG